MKFAPDTPASVRRAVEIYTERRRRLAIITAATMGTAATVAVVVLFFVADRYVVLPQFIRSAGPRFALLGMVVGGLASVIAWFRRYDPFTTAVRLDQAFPSHQDRWSSSLDLAERLERYQKVGSRASIDRLFADTEALPTDAAVTIVSRRGIRAAIITASIIGILGLFVLASPAFDIGLLWRRFIHPQADLPRDSSTRIVLSEVNGRPWTGSMPGAFPEGSPFNLRLELFRKPGLFAFGRHAQRIDDDEQLPPRLEKADAGGVRASELSRTGAGWTFSQPRLDAAMDFRIRADDGITQTFRADVTPRIKLAEVDTAIRFPRYTRAKDQPMQRLQGNRLSALADSVIDLHADFDREFQNVTATFEATRQADKAATPSEDQRIASQETKEQPADAARRLLRVQRRGQSGIRFTLPVEASGVLRLRAMGANGLASEEWVCAIEAVPDAPPKIIVTGLDPDTTIAPGETVLFQYRAEDDLAITDVAMDWSVAGGIHSSDLGGDEFLKNEQLGQKVVAGQQLIQRMDYKFYATEPFQFFLTAVDSKGQESRTEIFRVHTVSDDYATRFERGMELLHDAAAYQQRFNQQVAGIVGQLNIIAAAAGDAKKWDAKLAPLHENLLRTSQNYDDAWFFVKDLGLRYGGVPYRLDRSLQMLLTSPNALASRGDFVALAQSMKTTEDLPGVVQAMRTLADGQHAVIDAWGKAVDAESQRFMSERLLNLARGPVARLAALNRIQQPPEVAAANLKFNLGQIDTWLTTAAPLGSQPDWAPLIDAVKHAREQGTADAIIAAMKPVMERLVASELPPETAFPPLVAAMARPAPAAGQDRFPTVLARLATGIGRGEMLRPAASISLASPWLAGGAASYPPPASTADVQMMSHQVWETLRDNRAAALSYRYALNPQEAADREMILRERVLATRAELRNVAPEAIDGGARDRLLAALDRAAKAGIDDAALPGDLSTAIRAIGNKPVEDLAVAGQSNVDRWLAVVRKTADEYDQHATQVAKQAPLPSNEGEPYFPARMLLLDEATRLQIRTEGLESLYRAIKTSLLEGKLLTNQPAPEWVALEPLHGVQLAMSLAAAEATEGVVRIHVELANQPAKAQALLPVAGRNAQQLATRLRASAQLLETAVHGRPITFDYAQLMRDARAEGILGAMKEEYELVRSLAWPGTPATMPSEPLAKLQKSALWKVAVAERSLGPVSTAVDLLKSAAGAKPPEVLAALKSLQAALPDAAEGGQIDGLSNAINDATTARAAEPIANQPALARELQAIIDEASRLKDSLADQARLPVISTTAQQNRRFTTRDLPNVWVIQGVIDGFDRRWLYTMRDLELSMTRTMLELASRNPQGVDAMDLKLQYLRMVEWRARNFANDRRRNQGISLLAASAGPSLKLPDHIAEEFFRARNATLDEDFKPRIQAYYEELYRDLAK